LQFAQIPGVGSNKLEAYSETFTNAIRDYKSPSAKAPVIDPEDEAPFLVWER
jgi:hypothetical protein